jgi:hypothetical protein
MVKELFKTHNKKVFKFPLALCVLPVPACIHFFKEEGLFRFEIRIKEGTVLEGLPLLHAAHVEEQVHEIYLNMPHERKQINRRTSQGFLRLLKNGQGCVLARCGPFPTLAELNKAWSVARLFMAHYRPKPLAEEAFEAPADPDG